MAMLARESYGRRAPLWLAVPMLALWANLHGGYFVGVAAMGVYTAVCGAQDLAEGRGMRRAVRLATLTSAAALATLLNPYGLNDWLTVIPYLRNPFTLRHISEFRPLLVVIADFHSAHRPLFTFASALSIMALLLVTFALTPRADDLALFAIAMLMTVGALYAVRNTALAVIACCGPLCRHADVLIDRLRSLRHAGTARSVWIWRALHAALAVLAVVLAIRPGCFRKRCLRSKPSPWARWPSSRDMILKATFCANSDGPTICFSTTRPTRKFLSKASSRPTTRLSCKVTTPRSIMPSRAARACSTPTPTISS
jgi:hypothetical protein